MKWFKSICTRFISLLAKHVAIELVKQKKFEAWKKLNGQKLIRERAIAAAMNIVVNDEEIYQNLNHLNN